jgi:hypothetical protein
LNHGDEIKITLLYIKGTTDKIARILKKGNIRVIFTPPNTLKGMLDCAKDVIDPKHHKGVYTVEFCTLGGVPHVLMTSLAHEERTLHFVPCTFV